MAFKPETWKPIKGAWQFVLFQNLVNGETVMRYQHQAGFVGLSSLAWVNDEHEPETHWEWLVSFSLFGRERVSDKQLKWIKRDWNMHLFEEDNHEPGIARKFWLPVEERFRRPCACKDEEVIVQGDYAFSQKKPTQRTKGAG